MNHNKEVQQNTDIVKHKRTIWVLVSKPYDIILQYKCFMAKYFTYKHRYNVSSYMTFIFNLCTDF